MSVASHLETLFRRDLTRLLQQIEAFPDDETLWRTLPGITNPAGNLALHIEGNLRQFIGLRLGNVPYIRTRSLEFGAKGMPKDELAARIADLKQSIPTVIGKLSPEQMAMEYPEIVLETAISTEGLLIHLYGHLNWHLGEIDYLRRVLG